MRVLIRQDIIQYMYGLLAGFTSDASGGNLDLEVAICLQAGGHYESADELFLMASNEEDFPSFEFSSQFFFHFVN